MFRLILSIFVVVAVAGASAAFAMHGLIHEPDHGGHHAEMAQGDPLADAETALTECCVSAGGTGSASCFGDLLTSSGMLLTFAAVTMTSSMAQAVSNFSSLTLAVPTGPPKVGAATGAGLQSV